MLGPCIRFWYHSYVTVLKSVGKCWRRLCFLKEYVVVHYCADSFLTAWWGLPGVLFRLLSLRKDFIDKFIIFWKYWFLNSELQRKRERRGGSEPSYICCSLPIWLQWSVLGWSTAGHGKLGARNFCVSQRSVGIHAIGPYSTTFPGTLSESWIGSRQVFNVLSTEEINIWGDKDAYCSSLIIIQCL